MFFEISDTALGTIGLVVFLIFVFASGRVLYAFRNARLTRAWTDLLPMVNGKVSGDGGGAATSWLTGTYRGMKVQASMIPTRNRYPGETGSNYNYFDIVVLDVEGNDDWEISCEPSSVLSSRRGWNIKTVNKSLEAALTGSGIISMIARLGTPKLEYFKLSKKLIYSEDVTPQWVPPPERFTEILELLLKLTELNQRVNRPLNAASVRDL